MSAPPAPDRAKQNCLAGLRPPRLRDVAIDPGSFWGRRRAVNREVTIPSQFRILGETGRIEALDSGYRGGRHAFWDSDVAKWLEAALSELEGGGDDAALRADAEGLFRKLAGAAEPDGYLHSATSFASPESRYTNLRDGHELYSMGHVIEACCADIESGVGSCGAGLASRILDHLWTAFGPDGREGYCGHPEIELALMRLWRCAGDGRARQLAQIMVDRRGDGRDLFSAEAEARGEKPREHWSWRLYHDWRYYLAHRPVREQRTADGHAVRAMYLFCAMADLCAAGDGSLADGVDRLWDSVVRRRMYVTGGVGSCREGERFTHDYDLPDGNAYCETCAAIGLARWAQRMLVLRLRGEYGDILELALHNAMLAGVSLDGQGYFYGNPLAVHPHDRRGSEEVSAARKAWFGCACCPPNIARTIAQLGAFAYAGGPVGAAVHLYLPGTARVGGLTLRVDTDMPWGGRVRLRIDGEPGREVALALRVPGWCRDAGISVNGVPAPEEPEDGYIRLRRRWKIGDTAEMRLPVTPERLYAHPSVRACAGKVALRRGPIVYCLEDVDCGGHLDDLALGDGAEIVEEVEEGIVCLRAAGTRSAPESPDAPLYRAAPPGRVPAPLRFLPYANWGHRAGVEMRVWLRRGTRPSHGDASTDWRDCCRRAEIGSPMPS